MRIKSYGMGLICSVAAIALSAGAASAEELTIATVNNGDMIIMQKLSSEWENETGHKLRLRTHCS